MISFLPPSLRKKFGGIFPTSHGHAVAMPFSKSRVAWVQRQVQRPSIQGSKSNSPLSCFGKVNSKVMMLPEFAHQLQLPNGLVKLKFSPYF